MNSLNEYPLWTATITSFNEDSSIDFESFEVLLKRQEKAGNGILILGSTGENLSLSLEEKKNIVEFTLNQNLNVPVMCGVGGSNFNESKNWIEYLNTNDLSAYLLVTPLYTKPGAVGQTEWFRILLNKAEKPCMLYNVPSRTGKELSHVMVRELKNHPNFWAIKEASGSIGEFANYRSDSPSTNIFSGDDAMLPYYTLNGASGLVSVIANVWPEETKKYVELCKENKINKHIKLWKEAADALFIVSNPIPAKILLHEKGVIKSPALRLPLTVRELEDNSYLMQIDKKITEWNKVN
ncbi:MAG: 4-hydroxy-tetrahydrodipicolinate synthase [Melioribacteraceae bacterium]|nr:4-hydroxy-tetrahydrodipicolinate synthase [Melioribacteraceae bacterium]